MRDDPTAANRMAWDMMVPVHEQSRFYGAKAIVGGRSSLREPELSLVGCCEGLDLLHLQCHFGLDSLSWARLGARVTGVDFSPVAIRTARRLAKTVGIDICFECEDVQELKYDSVFDVVVTSYGVLCWLRDLDAWARSIARALRTGGRLVVVDFHPVLEAIHPGKMTGAKSYFGEVTPSVERASGSYAERSAPIDYEQYRWQHPVSAVVSSLVTVGFDILKLDEYSYCSYGLFDELFETRPGVWIPRGPSVWPYMFSVHACKRS